ncbi:MAG TPA: SDR family NAD(P)-dependent oxidoreductase [Kineosporiaceae bacterium]|nr:SDR family NAD(P)-dependent oxidoreductase [Kineosporiaceae bacterium]
MTHAGVSPSRAVVITGASSGIGAALARRLAARGEDLVLVARRRERLDELAREVAERYARQALVLPADLAVPGAARQVADAVAAAGIAVTGLVNSAGFGTAGPFMREDPDRIAAEIAVNVVALTELTRLLLPEIDRSGRGFLVNVSSTAAYQPLPGMAVYAASKAFVTALTEAVAEELRLSGSRTKVLALAPGPTETEFFAVGSDLFRIGQVLSVDEVVDTALAALARHDVPPSVIVGVRNKITAYLARSAPRRLTLSVGARLTRFGRA